MGRGMIADIPYLHCRVDRRHISHGEGWEEGYAFAIRSHPGRALGFEVMLKSGAHYRGVPIHAVSVAAEPVYRPLGDCQLWDCFTARPLVHVYRYLEEHEAIALLRSGPQEGKYLFTVEWLPDDRGPGWTHIPDQNKCGHVLALEDGCLCCLPTNRIAWADAYFCGSEPRPWAEGYRVQDQVYQAESSEWDVSEATGLYYRPDSEKTARDTPDEKRPS